MSNTICVCKLTSAQAEQMCMNNIDAIQTIQCNNCNRLYHGSCIGININTSTSFVCSDCLNQSFLSPFPISPLSFLHQQSIVHHMMNVTQPVLPQSRAKQDQSDDDDDLELTHVVKPAQSSTKKSRSTNSKPMKEPVVSLPRSISPPIASKLSAAVEGISVHGAKMTVYGYTFDPDTRYNDVRTKVKQQFTDALKPQSTDPTSDVLAAMTADDVTVLAECVASAVENSLLRDIGMGSTAKDYRDRARVLLGYLKDARNKVLRSNVISGKIPPNTFVALPEDDLLPPEMVLLKKQNEVELLRDRLRLGDTSLEDQAMKALNTEDLKRLVEGDEQPQPAHDDHGDENKGEDGDRSEGETVVPFNAALFAKRKVEDDTTHTQQQQQQQQQQTAPTPRKRKVVAPTTNPPALTVSTSASTPTPALTSPDVKLASLAAARVASTMRSGWTDMDMEVDEFAPSTDTSTATTAMRFDDLSSEVPAVASDFKILPQPQTLFSGCLHHLDQDLSAEFVQVSGPPLHTLFPTPVPHIHGFLEAEKVEKFLKGVKLGSRSKLLCSFVVNIDRDSAFKLDEKLIYMVPSVTAAVCSYEQQNGLLIYLLPFNANSLDEEFCRDILEITRPNYENMKHFSRFSDRYNMIRYWAIAVIHKEHAHDYLVDPSHVDMEAGDVDEGTYKHYKAMKKQKMSDLAALKVLLAERFEADNNTNSNSSGGGGSGTDVMAEGAPSDAALPVIDMSHLALLTTALDSVLQPTQPPPSAYTAPTPASVQGFNSYTPQNDYSYTGSNTGYAIPDNAAYSASNTPYGSTANTGYGASNTGYGASNTGYGASNNAYGTSNTGYGASNTGYGASTGYGSTSGYNSYSQQAPPPPPPPPLHTAPVADQYKRVNSEPHNEYNPRQGYGHHDSIQHQPQHQHQHRPNIPTYSEESGYGNYNRSGNNPPQSHQPQQHGHYQNNVQNTNNYDDGGYGNYNNQQSQRYHQDNQNRGGYGRGGGGDNNRGGFNHNPNQGQVVCKWFKQGNCKSANCRFKHG